jgi:hypothetical protein
LNELNTSVNLRARIAGETFGGAVSATTLTSTTGAVTAKTVVIPTSGQDVEIAGSGTELQVKNAAGTALAAHVGVGTDADHAMTPRWAYKVSAVVTNLDVADAAEADLAFTSAEYDTHGSMWNVANANRLVAPATGYYHVDLYAEFVDGAATMTKEYILLKHSADDRILTAASTINFAPGGSGATCIIGNYLCCSVDVYLTAGQYVYARVYQDSTADPEHVNARGTMHRIG